MWYNAIVMGKHRTISILTYLGFAVLLKYGVGLILEEHYPSYLRILGALAILLLGVLLVLRNAAKTIEETTEVLSERTKLAGGLLQSIGTAFPDMVLGIAAAIISLRLRTMDYTMAINYAIIAAATTFGSNIYNIGHAAWCLFRQNTANLRNVPILMFPSFALGGTVMPLRQHTVKPSIEEMDAAISISTALTILTAIVAVGMVVFGQVASPPDGFQHDLYQLIRPLGVFILIAGGSTIFWFRKSRRPENPDLEIEHEELYYRKQGIWFIFAHLILAGAAIFFTAEIMVKALEVISVLAHIPFVITGVLAGIIGCLGEMMVIHNFSVHPKGRIGDAIVGVAMDNIVTIVGAAVVALLGGIFLGGNSLILIFVIIFALNTVLISQISRLKNSVYYEKNP